MLPEATYNTFKDAGAVKSHHWLTPADTKNHAYPNLKSASLLSTGQLCYSDFSALFIINDVSIFNSYDTPVLDRKYNISDGLWDVEISPSQKS